MKAPMDQIQFASGFILSVKNGTVTATYNEPVTEPAFHVINDLSEEEKADLIVFVAAL